jgi:SAM-dependent methyltransferase
MNDRLKKHKQIWNNKEILRYIYKEWYENIINDLKPGKGRTVELGAGSGNFKEFKIDVISSDIENCEWLDMCFDAHNMPFEANSILNIVMIDVLHHLSNPMKFFEEAMRVLEKQGRIIIIEPFPSPFSFIIYKIFHPEPFIMNVDYFNKSQIENGGFENKALIPNFLIPLFKALEVLLNPFRFLMAFRCYIVVEKN